MGSCDALSGVFYAHSIFFLISLAICSFFSFLETSMSSIRPYKLKELSQRQSRYKKLLKAMEGSPDKVLSVILIAKNIADVTTTMVSGYIVDMISAQWQLSESINFFLSISVATIAILIFGEIIPKSIGKLHGERLFASTLGVINILYFCLYPLSYLTKVARFLVSTVKGLHIQEDHGEGIEKELQFLIEHSSEKGLLAPEKETMLMNVLRLDRSTVQDIMVPHDALTTPRADIVVPASMKLSQVLTAFRQQRRHRAVVVDSAGRVIGLVHLQDVLEQIVGTIPDEQAPAWPIIGHTIHEACQADTQCTSPSYSPAPRNKTSREKKDSTRITGFPD